MAARFNLILPKCIGEEQSAFLKGRQIVDNVIFAGECIKTLQSKAKKSKWCVLKLDMPTFDRLEWHYIINILRSLGFCEKWCNMINWCISSTSISFSINDHLFWSMKPTRRIRQGEALPPCLFILASDGLSRLIKRAESLSEIHGLKVAEKAPPYNTPHVCWWYHALCKASAAEIKCWRISFRHMCWALYALKRDLKQVS